jgi:hypothetical protein
MRVMSEIGSTFGAMLRDASTWWPAEGWRSAGWPKSVGVVMAVYCPSGTTEKAPRTIVGANLTLRSIETHFFPGQQECVLSLS